MKEIAIRKMKFVFAFIGFFVFSAVAQGHCPENSIGLKLNSSICYSFHPSLSQYVIAERECNSFGATVISVKNEFTNVYVAQLANLFFKHLEVEEIWTSGHRLINDETYQWVDGDEIEKLNIRQRSYIVERARPFEEQYKAREKFHQNENNCVAINLEKGFWKPKDCFTRLPFVCEFVGGEVQNVPPTATILKDFMNENERNIINRLSEIATTEAPEESGVFPEMREHDGFDSSIGETFTSSSATPTTTTPKPKECPETWSYNNITGFCYGVFGNMTWKNAESKCVAEDAHLASIHSQEEGAYVASLFDFGQTPWIGLYVIEMSNAIPPASPHEWRWRWTDGTKADYIQWAPGEPNYLESERCGHIYNLDSDLGKSSDYNNRDCSFSSSFICKKLPVLFENRDYYYDEHDA